MEYNQQLLSDYYQKRHSSALLYPPARKAKSKSSKLYALRIATCPGIYHDWSVAKTLIDGCPGAKYKGFFTLEECIQFIREQFPDAQFTKNENEDYIMDNPEQVMKIIEEARQKKEKNSGISMRRDSGGTSNDWERLRQEFLRDGRLSLPLNPEQESILNMVKSGNNVLIAGAPKSGKSFLIAHILAHFASIDKNVVVTSCSAIASLNTQIPYTVGWTGMGKALGTKKQLVAKVRKNTVARKTWAETDVLVIEDASMLSAFLLDNMDFLAREIKRATAYPFGGIQVIICGDLNSLSPPLNHTTCCPHCGQSIRVAGNSTLGIPPAALVPGGVIFCQNLSCQKPYHNSWLLYGFQSSCWESLNLSYCPLSQSYGACSQLNSLISCIQSESSNELAENIINERKTHPSGSFVRICGTEEEASLINSSRYAALTGGNQIKYECQDTILNNFDFSARSQLKEGFSDDSLTLKEGVMVIFVSEEGNKVIICKVSGFHTMTDGEISDLAGRLSNGTDLVRESVKSWLEKNRIVPTVLLPSGESKIVTCRLWTVEAYGKISGQYKWAPGQCYQALCLVDSIDQVYIENLNFENFLPDPRISVLKSESIVGEPMKAFLPPMLPSHNIPSMNYQLVNITTDLERRGSTMSMSSSPKDDPNMNQFSHLSQRRNSFQPITTYQDQQFQFMSSNHPDAYLSLAQTLAPPTSFVKYNSNIGRPFVESIAPYTEVDMEYNQTTKRRKTSSENIESFETILNRGTPPGITSVGNFTVPMNPDYVMEKRPSLTHRPSVSSASDYADSARHSQVSMFSDSRRPSFTERTFEQENLSIEPQWNLLNLNDIGLQMKQMENFNHQQMNLNQPLDPVLQQLLADPNANLYARES